jgi:ABC-type lipoprotein release transport system permease subunit
LIALVLIFTLIKPYFADNPLDFPFSDGILVAEPTDVALRACILLIITIFAGYFPARLVVKQKTLDAILGR